MLKELHNYVPNQTPVYAEDMNILGQAVRLLNNVSGADVFVDETGMHFRQRPQLPGLLFVSLTQTGGSNGNKTTAPTYTYDLYSVSFDSDDTPTIGDDPLDTARAPIISRPNGAVTAADYGLAIRASDTGYVLLWAWEKPGRGGC